MLPEGDIGDAALTLAVRSLSELPESAEESGRAAAGASGPDDAPDIARVIILEWIELLIKAAHSGQAIRWKRLLATCARSGDSLTGH